METHRLWIPGSLLLSWASLRASTRVCEHKEGTSGQLSSGVGSLLLPTNQDCLTHLHTQVSPFLCTAARLLPSLPRPPLTGVFCSYFHRICVWPSCCRQGRAKPLPAQRPGWMHTCGVNLWHTWQCTQTCLLTVQHSRSMKKTNACVPGGHFPPNICLTTEACTNVCVGVSTQYEAWVHDSRIKAFAQALLAPDFVLLGS